MTFVCLFSRISLCVGFSQVDSNVSWGWVSLCLSHLEFFRVLDLYIYVFIQFGSFQPLSLQIISLHTFPLSLTLPAPRIPVMRMLYHLMTSCKSLSLSSLFFILFPFAPQNMIILNDLCSSSLTVSSACSSPLLNTFCECLISVIAFTISGIFVWYLKKSFFSLFIF